MADKQSRLSEIIESELKGGKGAFSAFSGALDKRAKEKLDPRNMLFGGKGVTSLIGQKIFGKGYSATSAPEKMARAESGTGGGVASAEMISKLDSIDKHMESMATNMVKLVALSGGKPKASERAASFFKEQDTAEAEAEAKRAESSKKKGGLFATIKGGGEGGGKGILGSILGMLGLGGLSALIGGAGKLTLGLLKRIPLIGSIVMLIEDFFDSKKLEEGLGIGKVPALLGTILGGTEGGIKNAFKNAGKWAILGATLGSVVPGLGTIMGGLIGAVLGGVMGYFGGDEIASKIDTAFTAVGRMVEDAFDGLKDLGNILGAQINNLVAQITATAKSKFGSVIETVGKVTGITVLEERGKEMQKAAAKESAAASARKAETVAGVQKKAETREAAKEEARSTEDVQKALAKREYQAPAAGLGGISGKYESGKTGVATISGGMGGKDPGGVSYGKYQLSSKNGGTMAIFLKSPEGKPFASFFQGMEPGTKEFSAAYKKVVEQQGQAFEKAQHDFIERTHYKPVEGMASKLGFDTSNRGVQEALFSQSVQHGQKGNNQILENAAKLAGPNASAEQQVQAIYKARGEYVKGLSMDEGVKKSVLSRYEKEGKEVAALSTTPSASGTALASASTNVADGKMQAASSPVVVNAPNNTKINQQSNQQGGGGTAPAYNQSITDYLVGRAI
jgi:hypothetical protein